MSHALRSVLLRSGRCTQSNWRQYDVVPTDLHKNAPRDASSVRRCVAGSVWAWLALVRFDSSDSVENVHVVWFCTLATRVRGRFTKSRSFSTVLNHEHQVKTNKNLNLLRRSNPNAPPMTETFVESKNIIHSNHRNVCFQMFSPQCYMREVFPGVTKIIKAKSIENLQSRRTMSHRVSPLNRISTFQQGDAPTKPLTRNCTTYTFCVSHGFPMHCAKYNGIGSH